MQLELLSYGPQAGWSADAFPDLDSERTVVVLFGGSGFLDRPRPFDELREAYPRARMIGCSTGGEIFGTELRDDTLAVAVARFEHTTLASVSVPAADDSFAVGRDLARELGRDATPKGIFVLSDGLNVNGSRLVNGMNSALPDGVVVTGGLAADGDRFQRTWVVSDGTPRTGTVAAVAFYGDSVRIGHGSRGGWDVFGHERTVTRAEGNVLYELDHKPALQLYKEYLGHRADELPATAFYFPLAVWEDHDDPRRLVRTVLAIDEEKQALIFAGDVPQGWRAQLMKANFDRLVHGACEAAEMSRETMALPNGGETLAITISCVGRRVVLGERTEEEIEAALEVFAGATRQIGFYSYGEISPYAVGGCDLHNQTMTLTTIGEGANG